MAIMACVQAALQRMIGTMSNLRLEQLRTNSLLHAHMHAQSVIHNVFKVQLHFFRTWVCALYTVHHRMVRQCSPFAQGTGMNIVHSNLKAHKHLQTPATAIAWSGGSVSHAVVQQT